MYFQQSIDDNKGNPKGIWKTLKSLTKSQKSSKVTELRREDSTLETNTSAMANMLNEYFVNIAQEVKGKVRSRKSFSKLRNLFPRNSKINSVLSSSLLKCDKSTLKLPLS